MSPKEFQLLRYVMVVSTALIAFLCCLRISRPRGPVYGLLLGLLGIAVAVESIGAVTSFLIVKNNAMFNAYVLVEFVVLMVLVRRLRAGWRIRVGAALALGTLVWVVSFWRRGNADFLFTDAIMVLALLLMAFFLVLLWQLAETSDEPLRRVPEFWLFLGFVFYFGALFPLIGSLEYLWKAYPTLARNLYLIIVLLSAIRYTLTAVACIQVRRQQRST